MMRFIYISGIFLALISAAATFCGMSSSLDGFGWLGSAGYFALSLKHYN